MDGCTHGQWMDLNGKCHQLFSCEEGKGLYYPVNRLTVHERVSKLAQENCKHNRSTNSSGDFINYKHENPTLLHYL